MTDTDRDTDAGLSALLSHLADADQLTLLRTLVDTCLDALIVHKPDGTVVFYNEALRRLLGFTHERMAALEPFGWVTKEACRGASDRLESILHGGELHFRSTLHRHDGETVPTEVVAKRLDTERGPLVVATIRDVSEQVAAEERLNYLAYHDALTGLASRAAFNERLGTALAEARRHGDLVVLAYIDLDHFKPVNDRYGHSAGDDVLVEVGRRIEATVRTQDLVARLGGDEFVVLLSRPQSVDEVPVIAERLLETVRRPVNLGHASVVLKASIGFSVFDPAEDDERSLIVKADIAMYEAKTDPARPWRMWTPSMA